MEIYIAKSAGFCFGVRRAVNDAVAAIEKFGGTINTYGELIHNPQEVARLSALGIVPVSDLNGELSERIIIRTHGAGAAIMDKLVENGHEIIDLTCPFVKKIHNISNNYCKMGIKTVIIGDKCHPEVIGITGWCENSVVVSSVEDVKREIKPDEKIGVVSQTTMDRKTWDTLTAAILEINPGADINDTICSATAERQTEAADLATKVDAMFVVGGKSSSNTKKLYEVCKERCKNTFYIEKADEIDFSQLENCSKIGITAGASTPDQIIKEVFNTMEKLNNQETMSFEEMLDESLKSLNTGDTVVGTVVDVRPTEIVLELVGCKYNGIIDLANLSDDPTKKPSDLVKKGDELEAFVIQVDDNNGQVRLSRRKLEQEKNWAKVQEAFDSQEILDAKVVEIVNGGVNVIALDTKMFVPASQASDRFMEDLSVLSGKEVKVRVLDIAKGRRRRVVASIKSVLKEEKQKAKDAFWAEAEEGKEYTGTVSSIAPFGVFVNIGGVDGLVHISELSWKKITHPKQVVKEGDEINVYVKALDKENQKISLSCKKEEDNPWTKFVEKYEIGAIANGTVVRLVPFGAFVDLGGVDGLIHISEISWRRINHPSEVLKEGQVVEVIIKEIDAENQKISLGYKRTEDNPWEIFKSKYAVGDSVECKVVRTVAFGAFAEIIEGVDGLIHISQISNKHIATVAEALKPGDVVTAQITEIKPEDGKVSLSIKALLEDEVTEEAPAPEAVAEEAPAEDAE